MNSLKSNDLLAILILCALVILSVQFFYTAIKPFNLDGHTAVMNTDALLYPQYARAMAEGHPYQFNIEDDPTTGSTSHFYIFLLSIFYFVGLKGPLFIDFIFWLNAVFLLLCLPLYWFIVKKCAPQLCWPAALLLAFSGHFHHVFLGLSDMGLFVLLLFLVWYAALYRRFVILAISIFLLAITRPEGMVVVVLYGFVIFMEYLFKKEKYIPFVKEKLIVIISGIVGIGLILALNHILTGMFKFDSVLDKDHFSNNSFLAAIVFTAKNGVLLLREIVFGLTANVRQYYFVPGIAGLLIILGLVKLPWSRRMFSGDAQIETWWILAICANFAAISISEWQMVHNDRYIVWVFPILFIYLLRGLDFLNLNQTSRRFLFFAIICFQLVTYPYFIYSYCGACAETTTRIRAIFKLGKILPSKTTLGVFGGSGLKYYFPDWRIVNMGGVMVPYFRKTPYLAGRVKEIQYTPELQYNIFIHDDSTTFFPDIMVSSPNLIDVPSVYSSSIYLYGIDWRPLLNSKNVLQKEIIQRVESLDLVDRCDIGFWHDEKRCDYTSYCNYSTESLPFFLGFDIDGTHCVDAARAVIGGDYVSLKTIPGKNHLLVVRNICKAKVSYKALDGIREINTNTNSVKELLFRSSTGYKQIVQVSRNPAAKNVIAEEWLIPVPATAIEGSRTRFEIHGDHMPAFYWLFVEN